MPTSTLSDVFQPADVTCATLRTEIDLTIQLADCLNVKPISLELRAWASPMCEEEATCLPSLAVKLQYQGLLYRLEASLRRSGNLKPR